MKIHKKDLCKLKGLRVILLLLLLFTIYWIAAFVKNLKLMTFTVYCLNEFKFKKQFIIIQLFRFHQSIIIVIAENLSGGGAGMLQ